MLNRRELVAFLAAAVTAPLTYWLGLAGLALWLRAGGGGGPSMRDLMRDLPVILIAGLPIGLLAAAAVFPAYAALRRLDHGRRRVDRRAAAALVLLAACAGAVTAALLEHWIRGDLFTLRMPWWSGAAIGAVSALMFMHVLHRE